LVSIHALKLKYQTQGNTLNRSHLASQR